MTKKEAKAEYNKAYIARVKYTFDYISRDIYGCQRKSSRIRGHELPAYTLEDLRAWMNQQPNLRRLMDELPYTFDNIQLGSWKENQDNETAKKSKAIIQLTLEGEYIKEWSSAREAGREMGIPRANIGRVCRGQQNKTGGFRWEFK